jgi:hypothetical protein
MKTSKTDPFTLGSPVSTSRVVRGAEYEADAAALLWQRVLMFLRRID